jgi:predicted nucleic acid-binding protein
VRVFVDSNVVMYAAGAAHPHKEPCVRFLARVQAGEVQAVTSTEVLQEILHRYHRLGRPDVAQEVYALVVQLCSEVLPITIADTDACVQLLRDRDGSGSVRDALHVAVMRNNGLTAVATYDAAFDDLGVQRWTFD